MTGFLNLLIKYPNAVLDVKAICGMVRKSRVLFDSIDLDILLIIKARPYIKILELRDQINITHQNLKRHIDRLLMLRLIEKHKNKTSRNLFIIGSKSGLLIKIMQEAKDNIKY